MTPEGWRKAFEVFHVAVVHDAGTRAAYLDLCRPRAFPAAIRQAVEQLVAAHEAAGDFLEEPAVIRVQHTELPPPAEDQPAAARATDFAGTERFALVRILGQGGMGVVYEAHDRRRNEIVALKTLHRVNPTDIYHLKHEFRGLADVAHPNLASLYELVVEGPHCFFTMEIVNGVSLIQHLREGVTAGAAPPVERITRAFGQLAEGLARCTATASCIATSSRRTSLVTPEGRVVILDFGLIADVLPERGGIKERVAGTPAYTAPEDIAGVRATEASDWYSVGITLYQALTGRVPFEGPFDEQLRQKITIDPRRPPRSRRTSRRAERDLPA
jgi:serine/threonine protein kinase